MIHPRFLTFGRCPDIENGAPLSNGGAYNLNVDGSAPSITFQWGPAAGKIIRLSKVVLTMFGTTADPILFQGIFNIGAVSPGCQMYIEKNGSCVLDLFDSDDDHSTASYATSNRRMMLCADMELSTYEEADDAQILQLVFSFFHKGELVQLSYGDYVKFIVNDDLSSAELAQCRIFGSYE